MAADDPAPWRTLSGAEGRAARLAEVERLRDEGLSAGGIAERMEIARWVAEGDLKALRAAEASSAEDGT